MELRGRGRGNNCKQAGSLGVGMVGAREGQKTGRVGKMQALISADDGGRNKETRGYGQCCGANWVTSTKGAEWEERKDGYESKHWYLWTF